MQTRECQKFLRFVDVIYEWPLMISPDLDWMPYHEERLISWIVFQAVNMLQWKAGGAMCKLYTFLNYGTMATHSFILVFLSLFLYFVYKKPDALTSEEYQTVGRKNRWVN